VDDAEAMAEAAAMTAKPAAIVEMMQAGEIVLAFSPADQAASRPHSARCPARPELSLSSGSMG